jgi:class 3 adenylate cyclase/tetratricopeptide (TPR) repeat protein
MVGSAPLSAVLDPEDMSDRIAPFHKAVTDVTARFDGFVAQYQSDGVVIYFGYPSAQEHDPEQAVRAGLAIIASIRKLKAFDDGPLQARAGIATGQVVVGEQAGTANTRQLVAIGEAPNLAAQLQAAAGPGQVVIAASTRRLVGRMFDCRALGVDELKGLLSPAEAWQVRGETAGVSRFDARRAGELSPLVGRQEEMELLLRRWDQAKRGEGRVVLLSGEPGIGKSRLAESLLHSLADEPHTRLRYFCSPHHTHSPLYPFIAQLERAASFEPGEGAGTRLDKLEALLKPTAKNVPQDLALIAELLGVPLDGRYPAADVSPQQKREMTLVALLDQFDGVAAQSPVLIVFEDIHWIDPTSLDLLDRIIARAEDRPVLLIVTFRAELQPTWVGQPCVTMLPLSRLSRRDSAGIIGGVTKGLAMPQAVVEQVVAHTDGVPLFIEELTSMLLESGVLRETTDGYALDGPLPPLTIPTTLQASLVARLDRLAAVKEVAQIGAAIGREFSHELIASVSGLPPQDLDAALERLTTAGLISRRGTPPAVTYSFKHALVQDTAYSTLLRARRQNLHRVIAEALEERFPELVETRPELLAHHYTEAGCPAQAITYRLRAGAAAASKSANLEATDQYHRGLALVEALSDMRERAERELDLQIALGRALFATKLYSHPDVGRTYARASELSRQLGDDSREFTALRGRYLHHLNVIGEMDRSQHFAEEALRVAERLDDPARLVGAHMQLGVTLFWQGKLEPALAHYRRGIAMFDPNMQFPDWPGAHPGVQCQIWSSLISWMLGYPNRSLEQLKTAVSSVDGLRHPLTLAQTLCLASAVHIFRREPAAAADCAGRALRICEEQRILEWQAFALCLNGWALGVSGESEKGLAQIEQGLDGYGPGSGQPLFLALQADAQLAIGKPEAALEAVVAGLKRVEQTGGAPVEAQLHRLRGEALLAGAGRVIEAEMAIEEGIDVARRQNAKSWELRGRMSLARLRRQQGRPQEAVALLAPIYG